MNYSLRLYLFLCLIIYMCAGYAQNNNSVLNSGKWYKIKVTENNVFKLSYEDLKGIGFEAPENIRIYGNGGKQLPYINSLNNLNDLQEVPIFCYTGNDNTFGPGDYYLFYGEGPDAWQYNSNSGMFAQKVHEFATSNYYFLTASFVLLLINKTIILTFVSKN